MPPPWTRDDVTRLLVDLSRGRGAFAATAGELEAQLNWRRRFLASDREGWIALSGWARCQASGESIEEHRRSLGWSGRRFQEGWRRAADAIAAGLNAREVNTAALTACDEAEERLIARGRIEPQVGRPPLYRAAPDRRQFSS